MTKRIYVLDELRGLCVVLMVVYHALYTLAAQFMVPFALRLYTFFYPIEPLFAGIFILLCGVSCRLSRSNVRRGLWLAAIAVGMTLVLWLVMPSQVIWFGVLHCLATCILLFAATRPLLDRVSPPVGVVACAVLTAVLCTAPTVFGGHIFGVALPEGLLSCVWLFPLGFGRLFSADYFPLVPWMFVFAAGTFLGCWRDRLPAWCERVHIRPLAFVGRHSLLIYLAHQPLIFLLGQIIF